MKKNPPQPSEVRKPAILPFIQFGFRTFGKLAPHQAAKLAYYFFTRPRTRAKHKVSDEILESARVFEVLYGRIILKAYEWGSGQRIVLLVHGWESRGTALRSFVPALIEKGFKVVTFDGPAHGDSGGTWITLPNYAGAVKAILNRFGGVHAVISHSFGGASTVYALHRLDNSLSLERLVFIAVPDSMEKVTQGAIKTLSLPPSVSKHFIKRIEEYAGENLENISIANSFGHIKVSKALIVHDKDDPIVPFQRATDIASKWKNSKLLATEGLGHFRLVKNENIIMQVATFIAE